MALVPVAGAEEDDAELRDMTRRFWIATAFSIPLVALAMPPYFGIAEPFGVAPGIRVWLELVLGTPVVLWSGWPFFRKFARFPLSFDCIGTQGRSARTADRLLGGGLRRSDGGLLPFVHPQGPIG
jgi:hypothetical protein